VQGGQIGLQSVGRPGFGTDFQLLYTVASAWGEQQDTYDDTVIKETWQARGNPGLPVPGRPNTPNVYPLTVAPIIWPLTLMRFDWAILLWAAVILVSEAYLILRILRPGGGQYQGRPVRRIAIAVAVAMLMLCYPIRLNLASLNIGMVASALALAALGVGGRPQRGGRPAKGREWLAGVAMGLALVKYSVTGPLLLLMARQRQYRAIVVAFGVQVVLVLTATWGGGYSQPLEWVGGMRTEISHSLAPGEINAYDAPKGTAMHLHVRSLWHRFFRGGDAWHWVLVAGLVVAAGAGLHRGPRWRFRGPASATASGVIDLEAALIVAVTLASFYHRAYDLIPAMVLVLAWLVSYCPAHNVGRPLEAALWAVLALTIAPGIWGGWDDAASASWVRLVIQPACAWATCLMIPLLYLVVRKCRVAGGVREP
jgi:hypothetical protein